MDMKFSKVNSGLVSALYEGELANQVRAGKAGLANRVRRRRLSSVSPYSCGGNAMVLRVCLLSGGLFEMCD